MKKSQFNNIVVLVVLICTVFLSSCENFFTQIHSNTITNNTFTTSTGTLLADGTAKCTFKVSNPVNRSITSTALPADSFEFYFTCIDNGDLSFDENKEASESYEFILVTGMNYELSVIGYNGTNIVSELGEVCSFIVNEDGIIEDLPVLTMRHASSAYGSFEVTYSWDSFFPAGYEYDSIQVRLLTMDLTDTGTTVTCEPIVETDLKTSGALLSAENIPIGKYILEFKILAKDRDYNVHNVLLYKEFVHIKPYTTSTSNKADDSNTFTFTSSYFTIESQVIDIYNPHIAFKGTNAVFMWEDESETAPTCTLQYDNAGTWTDIPGTIEEDGTQRAVVINTYTDSYTYRLLAESLTDTMTYEFINKVSPVSITYRGLTKTNFTAAHIFEQHSSSILFTIYNTWSGSYNPRIYYTMDGGIETLLPPVSTGILTFTNNDPAIYTFYAGCTGAFLEFGSVHIMPEDECYVSSAALEGIGTEDNPLSAQKLVNNVEYLQKHGTAVYKVKILDDIVLNSLLELNMENLPELTIESSSPAVKRKLSQTADDAIMKIIGETDPKKLTIKNIEFLGGKGTLIDGVRYGGAVAILSSGEVEFEVCTFKGQVNISGGKGGKLYIGNGIILFENCSLSGGRVISGGMGGALYISKGDVTLNSCIVGNEITDFTGFSAPGLADGANVGVYGGAIAMVPDAVITSKLSLVNTIVGSNYSSNGGAFYLGGTGSIILTIDEHSKIYGNATSDKGGAIETAGSGLINLTIEGCIEYNTAENGSAVYIGGNNGSTTFTSTSIVENNNCTLSTDADKAAVYFGPSSTTETKLTLKGLISGNTFENSNNASAVFVCDKNNSCFYTGEKFKITGSDGNPGTIRLGDNVINKDGDYTETGILASLAPLTYATGTQVLNVPSDQSHFSVVPNGSEQWYIDNDGKLQKTNALVSTLTQLQDAIIDAYTDGTEYTIVLENDLSLPTIGVSDNKNIKIIANKDITLTQTNVGEKFLDVLSGCKLTMGDGVHTIIIDGQRTSNSNNSGIIINGTCTLNNVEITGFHISNGSDAAPVYVEPSGTLNLSSGTIRGNRGYKGGGVYAAGTFNMSGGSITVNTASNKGGGVYVETGGAFTSYDENQINMNTASDGNQITR